MFFFLCLQLCQFLIHYLHRYGHTNPICNSSSLLPQDFLGSEVFLIWDRFSIPYQNLINKCIWSHHRQEFHAKKCCLPPHFQPPTSADIMLSSSSVLKSQRQLNEAWEVSSSGPSPCMWSKKTPSKSRYGCNFSSFNVWFILCRGKFLPWLRGTKYVTFWDHV